MAGFTHIQTGKKKPQKRLESELADSRTKLVGGKNNGYEAEPSSHFRIMHLLKHLRNYPL